MSTGIFWDYEESVTNYYHIYCIDGPLENKLSGITIDIPETSENDADIKSIVDALRRIERRQEEEG